MSGCVNSSRHLVLHADDFGMNTAVNSGILAAFRRGLLTSTSLLANAPSAETACRSWPNLLAEHEAATLQSFERRQTLGDSRLPFDLGIHLNLTQGRPLTTDRYPAELLDKQGRFPGIGTLFRRLSRARGACLTSVAAEFRAQIEWMCDRGFRPSHVNGHQYVELIPAVSALIPELMSRYAIPVVRVACEPRLMQSVLGQGRFAAWGLSLIKHYYGLAFRRRMQHVHARFPDCFFGTAHAGRINQDIMRTFLREPFTADFTEIGLHPGSEPADDPTDDAWNDPLSRLRPAECEWLCHPELAKLLKSRGIVLGRLRSLGTPPEA
jgi:predicted glycoside hydrolase/deacetylase ChbG (UPF0249 family)